MLQLFWNANEFTALRSFNLLSKIIAIILDGINSVCHKSKKKPNAALLLQ